MNDTRDSARNFPEATLDRIEADCERFELELRQGATPSIEAYLREAEFSDREALQKELRKLESFYRTARRDGTSRSAGHQHSGALESLGPFLPSRSPPAAFDTDFEDPLRRRLRTMAVAGSFGFLLELLRVTADPGISATIFEGAAYTRYRLVLSVLVVGFAASAWTLTRLRAVSVRQLRWIEVAMMSSVVACAGWLTYMVFSFFLPQLSASPQNSGLLLRLLAQSEALFWVTLILSTACSFRTRGNAWLRYSRSW